MAPQLSRSKWEDRHSYFSDEYFLEMYLISLEIRRVRSDVYTLSDPKTEPNQMLGTGWKMLVTTATTR